MEKGIQLPWREAGPPNHHDDKVDSDQQVVDKELSLSLAAKLDRVGESGGDETADRAVHVPLDLGSELRGWDLLV